MDRSIIRVLIVIEKQTTKTNPAFDCIHKSESLKLSLLFVYVT